MVRAIRSSHAIAGKGSAVFLIHGVGARRQAWDGVIERLVARGVEVLVHEPTLTAEAFLGCEVVLDLDELKRRSDVIVASRRAPELEDVEDRVYTRDVYGRD